MKSKRIGVVGTLEFEKQDRKFFFWIGRAIFRLGHQLTAIQEKGSVNEIRKGFRSEGGTVTQLTEKLVEESDQTLAFVDDRLTEQLTRKFPDIDERADIVLIKPSQYEELRTAILDIMAERDITPP